jgi:long-chain fatty acid transport protein
MNSRCTARLTAVAIASALTSSFIAAPALGAGFALQENSGSGLGNAYAGGAAVAEDASTVWSNAAGMARLGSAQVVGAVNLIQPSLNFSNSASQPAAQQPLGGEGGDAGSLNVVPNLYFTYPIDSRWTLGIGVNAPFGLVSEYDSTWTGRFQGIKSEIEAFNVNPALSWKLTDSVALGAGVNFQRLEATFTSKANYSGYLLGAAGAAELAGKLPPGTAGAVAQTTAGLESGVKVSGSDNTWGWNLGILVDIDKGNRIGAQYRSAMKYTVSGSVEFTNPALPALPPALAPVVGALATAVNSQLSNSGVTSKIKLPEIVNVSYFGSINPQWDVMADLQYTGWSSIQELNFVRTDGTPLQSTTENFSDAWRFALGANYRHSEQWLFRGGLAYDQSPVQSAYRTVRLPDADRTWLALGAQYRMSPKLWFDFGAAYVWVRSASIDDIGSSTGGRPPSVAQNGLVNGSYHNNVVIVSGQLSYAF